MTTLIKLIQLISLLVDRMLANKRFQIIAISTLVGMFAYKIHTIMNVRSLTEKDLLAILAVFLSVTLVFITNYLADSTVSRNREIKIQSNKISSLANDIINKKKQDIKITEKEIKDLAEILKNKVQAVSEDEIIESIKSRILKSEQQKKLSVNTKKTLERIYLEIIALRKRGNINLMLGVATAFLGVAALLAFFFFDTNKYTNLESFVIGFLPRLSIALIVEVFSYFFLRLYKSSLAEIKYFQNEATNIELHFIALETAIEINDKELIRRCMAKLIETERNPILAGDQTTRELKLEELSGNQARFSADQLAEILKIVKPDSSKSDGDPK